MKIAVIGECMLELAPRLNNTYHLGFGGDTLNTAVYLARCGGEVDYITALGDDPFSTQMINAWEQEGIGTQWIKRKPGALPGMYLIENDKQGERSFYYWRDSAPAKQLFDDWPELLAILSAYPYLYLSGISLSLYSQNTLDRLWPFLDDYRANGGKVAFDLNYRERNWPNRKQALAVLSVMMQKVDISLPSYSDEIALHGPHSKEDCLQRNLCAGASEVVIKDGINDCLLHANGQTHSIGIPKTVSAVDTTAAGDSFNGAYLAFRLRKEEPLVAVAAGQRCAAQVIKYPGAIIPR